MKERPIFMADEMVRAILAGTKTETRRVVKGVGLNNCLPLKRRLETHVLDAPKHGLCPYGNVGDRLWVREAWKPYINCFGVHGVEYADGECNSFCGSSMVSADHESIEIGVLIQQSLGLRPLKQGARLPRSYIKTEAPLRPSTHMPRWASRITLEITGVRVERLRDITEDGAKAEGVAPYRCPQADALMNAVGGGMKPCPYTSGFANLWNSIAKPGETWDANPWVWVVQFRRVEGGAR